MSILINGMEMPKNCKYCKFRKTELQEDPDWCLISEESLFELAENDCPLIEVPEDVQPVKHGRWLFYKPPNDWAKMRLSTKSFYVCNICGNIEDRETNYCSKCGAKMDS